MPRVLTVSNLPDDDEAATEIVDHIAHRIGNGFTSGIEERGALPNPDGHRVEIQRISWELNDE
jgi:hypothetical protein